MTDWRALTVMHPHCWGICYAGKNVENRVWPIPPKHLGKTRTVYGCSRIGGTMAEGYAALRALDRGEKPDPPKHADGCPGDSAMHHYDGGGRYRVEDVPVPFRVMLHAGASWDEDGANWLRGRGISVQDLSLTDAEIREVVAEYPELERTANSGPLMFGLAGNTYKSQPFGAVVAVVEFTGCHHQSECYPNDGPADQDKCSDWAMVGWESTFDGDFYHWQIGDVRVLGEPVRAKGRQRLWIPDAETIAAVEAQLVSA